MILVVALVLFVTCVGCFGATALHGAWEGALAFGFPFAIQTDSDTYSKLRLAYTVSDWTFASLSTFGVSGLLSQQFDTSGSLGSLVLKSQLLFSPIAGSGPGLIFDSKTANQVEHRYDLGIPYFVDWVSVTSITLVPPATQWLISTSIDGTTWENLTWGPVTGQIRVGKIVRYVAIVVDPPGSGYIDASFVQISVSAQSWVATALLVRGGVTLYGTMTIATGTSGFSFGVIGSHGDNLPVTGTLSFIIAKPSCSLCFDKFEGTFAFSFGCLDLVTATLKMRNPQTVSQSAFEEFALSVTGLDVGLSSITFDAELVFELAEKTITLTPVLHLATDTCFTVYASLGSGTAGPWQMTSLLIYGIRVAYTWNGVSFESLSYLDDLHYVKDTYWERFTIKSVGDTCCGGRFEFSVSTYFDKTSLSLFDWAETEASISFGVTAALAIRFKVVVEPAGPEELVFGWLFSW
jgi:hypothetical protein